MFRCIPNNRTNYTWLRIMSELSPTNEISPFLAILWCFYPIGILVFIELLFSSDDDDDDEGGGVMSPVGVYQGA